MSYSINAQEAFSAPDENTPAFKLLNQKIEYYKRLYPEILFLTLKGGDEALNDMVVLDLILGHQPASLDYEHPPELREDLMYVSNWRILTMLQNNAPSASLFKADEPVAWQEHVCVLTISPDEVAADSVRATGHLLNLPDKIVRKFPKNTLLLAEDYLEYVIDHEVYHCLYAMYVGPQKMSDKELWAEYSQYIGEQGADAYAMAMHIKNRHSGSAFARNIQRIRGMSLYSVDPDHMTPKALAQVISIPRENIINMSQKKVFEMAILIRADQTISYEEYVKYLASAVLAMKLIGVEESLLKELEGKITGLQADPEQVTKLATYSRRCLAELKGENHTK